MRNKNNYFERNCILIIFIFTGAFYILPFMLFGSNSIVTIHDNLDFFIPWNKMFRVNNLFFEFDTPTSNFGGMSTLYYSHQNFSFLNILYSIFNEYVAYAFQYYLSLFFGFISMYILLKKTIGINSLLSTVIAICYAVLPVVPVWNIGVSTLPIIISIFHHFAFYYKESDFSWKILFLLLYPFFSVFTSIGIFILGFWFIGLIILTIKNRQLNLNLLFGFILLCIGYVLVDLRLFYVMFILRTPLNRGILRMDSDFKESFIRFFFYGFHETATLQFIIILPLALLISLFCIMKLYCNLKKQPGTITNKLKIALINTNYREKMLFILMFLVYIFSLVNALYLSGFLDAFISRFFPILNGFNWGRVYMFNKILWYTIFAICLQIIMQNGINNNIFHRIKLPLYVPRLIVLLLAVFQLGYITLSPIRYKDPTITWINEIAIKTGIAEKLFPNKSFHAVISYKEFFAADLFEQIKRDISYTDEMVAALGYHPSVLMYNGFNCIDGYSNSFPLSYMQKFKTLIAPELEINQWAREYYDRGGRMYIYNTDLHYRPTRNKDTSPVQLRIDMDVFKHGFNGKYILSRAEISNADSLGLRLVHRYYDEESIYTIYLYGVL